MELWKDKAVFRDLIVAASHQFEIPTFFVEKDFYLMSVLQHAAAVCPALVFRGGTSLSKAYRAINRFSEDLDLSVLLPSNFSRRRPLGFNMKNCCFRPCSKV